MRFLTWALAARSSGSRSCSCHIGFVSAAASEPQRLSPYCPGQGSKGNSDQGEACRETKVNQWTHYLTLCTCYLKISEQSAALKFFWQHLYTNLSLIHFCILTVCPDIWKMSLLTSSCPDRPSPQPHCWSTLWGYNAPGWTAWRKQDKVSISFRFSDTFVSPSLKN